MVEPHTGKAKRITTLRTTACVGRVLQYGQANGPPGCGFMTDAKNGASAALMNDKTYRHGVIKDKINFYE